LLTEIPLGLKMKFRVGFLLYCTTSAASWGM
jgi:hypothetical protein